MPTFGYSLFKLMIFLSLLFLIFWLFDEKKKYFFKKKNQYTPPDINILHYAGNNVNSELDPEDDYAKLLKKIESEYCDFNKSLDNYYTLEELNRDVDPYEDVIDPLDPANEDFFKGKSISEIYDSQVNLYKNRTHQLYGFDNQYMDMANDNNKFVYKSANFGNEF